MQLRLVALQLTTVVIDVQLLDGLVILGLIHELLVLTLRGLLILTSLGLQPSKIRQDHLQHADHACGGALLALLRGVEGGRLLYQIRVLRVLSIELLQHLQRLRHRLLRLLGLRDRLLVLRLLLVPRRRRRAHRPHQVRHPALQAGQPRSQLVAAGASLVHLRGELVHRGGLLVPGVLVGPQLGVAPALVGGLGVGLVHELGDEVLDHLLHLLEGVLAGLDSSHLQRAAPQLLRRGLQEVHHLLHPIVVLHQAPQLGEGVPLPGQLEQLGEVLVRGAGHGLGSEDLHGLLDGLNLAGAGHLPVLVRLRLAHALVRGILQVLRVRLQGLLGLLQVLLVGGLPLLGLLLVPGLRT
mmetsp:Transcript_3115/g.7412  ORF Transcript_3115/g.7412 Transcript_3115/m.7412 type:complete len:353 (-) Transcript_3115:790-1848(-)